MSEQRASKKQREVLEFIDGFIKEHGFGPSYREIMRALGYKSVSTVAAHVNELITRGYLYKRDNSARSLHVISTDTEVASVGPEKVHLQWLRQEIIVREADAARAKEAEVLKAALALLDQTDEE